MIRYLENKGKETIRDLIKNYKRLGLEASGDYARALKENVTRTNEGYRLIITGKHYGEYMENGRQYKTMGNG